jgi:hypothetical protein
MYIDDNSYGTTIFEDFCFEVYRRNCESRKTGKRLPLIVGDDSSGSIFRNITTAFIYKRTRIGTSFVNISSQALRPSINRKSIATPNSVHHGGNPPGYPRRFKPSSSSRYQEMMRGTSNGSFSVPLTPLFRWLVLDAHSTHTSASGYFFVGYRGRRVREHLVPSITSLLAKHYEEEVRRKRGD